MKRLLHIIICVVLLCSCNNGKKQAEIARQQAYDDSIAEVIKQAEIAEQRRLDSLAEYAWGDVKFGMSHNDVINSETFKDWEIRHNYPNSLELHSSNNTMFHTVFMDFYKDRLYEATFYGYAKNENCFAIIESLTKKYGPAVSGNPIPDESDYKITHSASFYLLGEWIVSYKTITVGIQNEKRLTNWRIYNLYCRITNAKEENIKTQDEERANEEKRINQLKQQKEKETILLDLI